jgi:UDP-N-acetylmuramoyl-L-alanyl-D-glutamate--2,6-diaminopimelate ligase
MRLKKLIEPLENHSLCAGLIDFQVRGISCNSKSISRDFLFVAVKGTHIDGNIFIPEAIEKGARAVIFQDESKDRSLPSLTQDCPSRVTFIKVKDVRKALASLSRDFYRDPSSKIKVVGITGTNGKTTIAYLIEAIVKEAGGIPAVIGTVNYRFQDTLLPSLNTTPGPLELQSLLARMHKEGVTNVAMEVSSHALDQARTAGIKFKAAIFTNLTQDHLDYHLTLDNYFEAKSKLFKDLGQWAYAVINNDDEYGRRLVKLTEAKTITYGIDNKADITANHIKFGISHTEFVLTTAWAGIKCRTGLIGRHNVYNILAAVSWAISEGIDLKAVSNALKKLFFVPGRLEKINSAALGFTVFVDYAHTEDALKNVIKTLREVSGGKIIVVFGCGGERDKTKRPKMGEVVSELADYAVITSDNPRSEEPLTIIKEIIKGIKKDNYCVIPDRKVAIQKSLSLARRDDIVLVAGKGHEDYQILKTGKIYFDDREVVRECLKLVK